MLRPIFRNAGIQPRRIAAALFGWRHYSRDRKAYRLWAYTLTLFFISSSFFQHH